jgi:hypothetical protein
MRSTNAIPFGNGLSNADHKPSCGQAVCEEADGTNDEKFSVGCKFNDLEIGTPFKYIQSTGSMDNKTDDT